MRKNYLTVPLSLCGIMLLWVTIGIGARYDENRRTLIGRVIARDPYIGLAHLSSPANVEVFIVRIEKANPAGSSPQFVKVRYEDYEAESPLPSGLLDGKMLWRFSLKRDENCDQTVSDGMFVLPSNSSTPPESGSYVLLKNAGSDLPKVQSVLPCFIVQRRGINPVSLSK